MKTPTNIRERALGFMMNQEHNLQGQLKRIYDLAGELLPGLISAPLRGRKDEPAKEQSKAQPRSSLAQPVRLVPDVQSRVSMFPPHPALDRYTLSEGEDYESDMPSPWLRHRAAVAAAALRQGTGVGREAEAAALYRITHSTDPQDVQAAELLKRGVALMLSNEREIPLARRHLSS